MLDLGTHLQVLQPFGIHCQAVLTVISKGEQIHIPNRCLPLLSERQHQAELHQSSHESSQPLTNPAQQHSSEHKDLQVTENGSKATNKTTNILKTSAGRRYMASSMWNETTAPNPLLNSSQIQTLIQIQSQLNPTLARYQSYQAMHDPATHRVFLDLC